MKTQIEAEEIISVSVFAGIISQHEATEGEDGQQKKLILPNEVKQEPRSGFYFESSRIYVSDIFGL